MQVLLAAGLAFLFSTAAFPCARTFPAGKGGWTAERKYEMDSGAYYINLLWNYYHSPGLYDPDRLLLQPAVHDAVLLLLKVQGHSGWAGSSWMGRLMIALLLPLPAVCDRLPGRHSAVPQGVVWHRYFRVCMQHCANATAND